jgi:sugar phosphate isomerase/epimerase
MIRLNLSSAEMRAQPIEAFMGARAELVTYPAPRPPANQTAEQRAEQRKANAEELLRWRREASFDAAMAFRKKYEDAGVRIQIMKVDAIDQFTDDEIDYMFRLAKTVGASAISCEIPLSHTERLGKFGERHKMMIGYHGHTNITSPEAFGRPQSWETAMSYSKYNGINLDIGHFTAGNNMSPIPFLTKYHDRVTHIHVKDRKFNNSDNMPFGQGDTPVVETLQLMKKEKWKFPGMIEFEYKTPQGSTQMAEIAKCVEFCRRALV